MSCSLFLAVAGFQQAVYEMSEDARLDTEFRLSVKGTTQVPGFAIGGRITARADGTASKNTAFIA